MGWKTLKTNHHWKGCLKTGKLLFPLLGGTWAVLVLCVLMETFKLLKTAFWLSPPLWETLPHSSSTSRVVIYSMNSSQQQQCWLIWTLLSQDLTRFTSALKINFALTKAECSCEPDALGAPCCCCCCLLLFRSSLSVPLFVSSGMFSQRSNLVIQTKLLHLLQRFWVQFQGSWSWS